MQLPFGWFFGTFIYFTVGAVDKEEIKNIVNKENMSFILTVRLLKIHLNMTERRERERVRETKACINK